MYSGFILASRTFLTMIVLALGLFLSGCGDGEGTFAYGPPGPAGPTGPGGVTGPTGATGATSPGTPPAAVADEYLGLGNTALTVSAAQGVLANDASSSAALTAAVQTAPTVGTLNLNADGSFTYTPPTGFRGRISFTYTATNAYGSSNALVTLNLTHLAWYVDNSVASSGDGAQGSPFVTLKQAEAASGPGDVIFVYEGSSDYSTGIFLQPKQKLISERAGLVFENSLLAGASISDDFIPDQTIVPPNPSARPVITNRFGVGVQLAQDNAVVGFQIGDQDGDLALEGVLGSNLSPGAGHLISDNEFLNPGDGASALWIEGVNGEVAITDNSFRGIGGFGVRSILGGDAPVVYVSTSFLDASSIGLQINDNTFLADPSKDAGDAVFVEVKGVASQIFGIGSLLDLDFQRNTITGDAAAVGSFENGLTLTTLLGVIGVPAAGQIHADISDNNTITDVEGSGINIVLAGGDLLVGLGSLRLDLSVADNAIRNLGGDGIGLTLTGNLVANAVLRNNVIENPGFDGIWVNLIDTLDTAIFSIGNTISDTTNFADSGILYQIDITENDAVFVSDGDRVLDIDDGLTAQVFDSDSVRIGLRNADYSAGGSVPGEVTVVSDGSTLAVEYNDVTAALATLENLAGTFIVELLGTNNPTPNQIGTTPGPANVPPTP